LSSDLRIRWYSTTLYGVVMRSRLDGEDVEQSFC
jgi:hypothetical protein